jgi:hypothetical protein
MASGKKFVMASTIERLGDSGCAVAGGASPALLTALRLGKNIEFSMTSEIEFDRSLATVRE